MKRRNLAPRRGVLAGGNWIIDHIKLIDAWPPQDTLVSILSQSVGNGGAPYNVLKNLAKLGARFPLEAIGLVGPDPDGRAIRQDCRAHRIDTKQLRVTRAAATSFTDVMTVAGTGRRTFFHQRGANARLDVEHFRFDRTRARIFHLGYLLLLDRLDALDDRRVPRAGLVLQAARACGLKTSLDIVSESSNRFQGVALPVLPHVDYFFCNDFEAERLTSIALRQNGKIKAAAVAHAARKLVQAGVREWVILHFPEAVYACNSNGEGVWQAALRIPPSAIKGAAGAGDALAAGVLWGLHESWPMEKGLRLGVCAAAASLFHASCSEAVPPVKAALALGQQYGFQSLPA